MTDTHTQTHTIHTEAHKTHYTCRRRGRVLERTHTTYTHTHRHNRDIQRHTHTEHTLYTHPDTQQSQTHEIHRDTRTHTQKHNIDTQTLRHTTYTLHTRYTHSQRHRNTPHTTHTLLHTHNTRTHAPTSECVGTIPFRGRLVSACTCAASTLPLFSLVYAWTVLGGAHVLCVHPSHARTVVGSTAQCDSVSG